MVSMKPAPDAKHGPAEVTILTAATEDGRGSEIVQRLQADEAEGGKADPTLDQSDEEVLVIDGVEAEYAWEVLSPAEERHPVERWGCSYRPAGWRYSALMCSSDVRVVAGVDVAFQADVDDGTYDDADAANEQEADLRVRLLRPMRAMGKASRQPSQGPRA